METFNDLDDYWPNSPYSGSEQTRIMRDLEESKRTARVQQDDEKLRNLKDLRIEND